MTLLLLPLALASDPAFPPVSEVVAGGQIDWTHLRLEVSAMSERTVGAWKDVRLQEQDALDRLAPRMLNLAPLVHLTPDQAVGDLMAGDDDLALRLREGLQDWHVDETRYISSGRVEMDAALDLQLWLRPALVAGAKAPPPAPLTGTSTGVLVDVRGLDFKPSLVPTLLSPDGAPVFGLADLNAETVRRGPPVIYATDPVDPAVISRVGEAPLLARAQKIGGDGEVLLLDADAAALRACADLPSLLAAGKVVLVVGP